MAASEAGGDPVSAEEGQDIESDFNTGHWTPEEKEKFVTALAMYRRSNTRYGLNNANAYAAFIGTRLVL